MKNARFVSALLLSATAQANSVDTVFPRGSALPTELQARVLEAVKAKCGRGLTWNTLRETGTRVREERIDQGVIDYVFTTDLDTTFYFDGMHPVGATITVVSAQYAIDNPSVGNLEIRSVKANADICD